MKTKCHIVGVTNESKYLIYLNGKKVNLQKSYTVLEKCWWNWLQEQLEWITETKLPDEKWANLIRITVEDFNRSCNLFRSTEMAELYAQLSGNVGRFFPVPFFFRAFVRQLGYLGYLKSVTLSLLLLIRHLASSSCF